MTTEIIAVFVIDRWDEEVIEEHEGAHIVRTDIGKTFSGELTGTSLGWMTMARAQEGSMAYVGFERIAATIEGKTGLARTPMILGSDRLGPAVRRDHQTGGGTAPRSHRASASVRPG